MVVVYILHYSSKHFTRAIFIEEKKNKTKSKNYIGLFATISAPPIYIIYVHEKLRTSENIDRC